jgi:hypothetical protein
MVVAKLCFNSQQRRRYRPRVATAAGLQEVLGRSLQERNLNQQTLRHLPSSDQRIEAAIEAAPYFASKMASIQMYIPPEPAEGRSEQNVEELSDEDLPRG